MKVITINLAEKYLSGIKVLTDKGIYQSRSEAIRKALKNFLLTEQKLFHDLDPDYFESIIKESIIKRGVIN